MGIYENLGLQPVINVAGPVTRLGGAPMPPEVLSSFCQAADETVPLDQLQGAASQIITEITGAEAGIVTSGAAAALTLGAAAILTGDDPARMDRLPDCSGFPHEFVMPREQRNGYDHAVRATGARLVEVGYNEMVAGAGVRRCEAWELAAAIHPQTAGVFFVEDPQARPRLREVVKLAHARGLPVLVDAAAELPPRANLREILATGADLVAFSGGKAIRGPQASGILCGRRDLVGAAALQMLDMDDRFELFDPPPQLIDKARLSGLPRQGIGRALKVSKEQIVALLTALRLFASGAYDRELPLMRRLLDRLAAGLAGLPVECRLLAPANQESPPILEIVVQPELGRTATEVCRRLRLGSPAVYVGQACLDAGKLLIHPLNLNESRTAELLIRLRAEFTP